MFLMARNVGKKKKNVIGKIVRSVFPELLQEIAVTWKDKQIREKWCIVVE